MRYLLIPSLLFASEAAMAARPPMSGPPGALSVPSPIVPPFVNATSNGDVSQSTRVVSGSTVARTLASTGLDRLNVRDCGAAMNGTTNDAGAFQSCVNLMSPGQVLYIPPGGFNISYQPTVPNGPIGFDLGEDGYGGGTTPVINVVNDLPVRGMLGSGWYFSRLTDNGPYSSGDPTVRIDGTQGATSNPGGVGNQSSLQTNCRVPNPTTPTSYGKNYTWCNETVINDSHIGPAQNVAMTGSLFRPYDALNDGFGPRGPGWALYWEANDQTGENSTASGTLIGAEGDIYAGGYDFAGRLNLHLGVGRSASWMTAAEVGSMLNLSVGSAGTSRPDFMDRGVDFANAEWATAAVDTADGQSLTATLPVATAQTAPGQFIQLAASVTASLLGPASPSTAATPAPTATIGQNAATQQIAQYWYVTDATTPANLPAGEQVSAAPTSSGGGLVVPLSENPQVTVPKTDQLVFTAPFPGDVLNGETVSGTDIAPGTKVWNYNQFAGTVTLTTSTTAAMPAGTNLTFAANAPAIRIGDGQTIDLSGDGNHLLTHLASGLSYQIAGKTVLSVDESGSLGLGGHVVNSGPAPTLSACGSNPSISATASDRHGTINPGSGATSCTINFHAAYGAAPDVQLTAWSTSATPFVSSVTPGALTVGFAAPGKFTYLVEQ